MAKNNHHKSSNGISPDDQLILKGRSLPLGNCYISTGWQDQGLITIVVTRNHANGNFSCGLYLVDMFCLGLKETLSLYNEYDRYLDFIKVLKEEEGIEECSYELVHNIIYGAIAFAEDLGFKPAENFKTTQYILKEDDDRLELINIQFGLSGKPAIFLANEKHPEKIIATLEESVGPDGYTILDQ